MCTQMLTTSLINLRRSTRKQKSNEKNYHLKPSSVRMYRPTLFARWRQRIVPSNHWRSKDFWLGGPVNFHHWLHLLWTTFVTVRVSNNRHWKYGTHKTERQSARCGAPKTQQLRRRGGGEGSGEGLCPSPENFSNFCLEMACYSAFWKQFFRLDSSLFTDQIVTLTTTIFTTI